MAPPVPTLLVTGFLGAGKTTLLSGWLAQRPAGERWAVVVNEFGRLGIDAALLARDHEGPGAVEVLQVAGGCACCAARTVFGATLARLLRRGPWDRLFIEATGLGHPAALVDALREPSLAAHLAVLPVVAVVDAGRAAPFDDRSRPGHEAALDQIALARLLVLNRAGASGDSTGSALARRLAALPPWPRPVLAAPGGTVPLGQVLAALADAAPTAFRPRSMRAPKGSAGVHDSSWSWPAAVSFDRARLEAVLQALAGPAGVLQAGGLLRAKGVFRTARAWYGWQWAEGGSGWQETAWRADSRLEVLASAPVDLQMVEQRLRAAVWAG